MVRVISEKLFSPPRSRHGSGEASSSTSVDKDLAARAVKALSSLYSSNASSRRDQCSSSSSSSNHCPLSDYESSSDSHWDSEVDGVEGGGGGGGGAGGAGPPPQLLPPSSSSSFATTQGEECSGGGGGEDVLIKRKERRRERNKLSAQAYRIRRREQGVKQQHVLKELQEKNWRLKEQVHSLEEEINQFRRTAVVGPPSLLTAAGTCNSAVSGPAQPLDTPLRLPSREDRAAVRLFRLEEEEEEEERKHLPGRLMDNDPLHHRLLSPVVDNFSSQPPPPPPPPLVVGAAFPEASPSASPSSYLSSSSSFRFAFPAAPSSPVACPAVGRHPTPPGVSLPSGPGFDPTTSVACTDQGRAYLRSQCLFQVPGPPPPPRLPPPPPPTNVNANAEERRSSNLNTLRHSTVWSLSRQKNDNVNNNNNDTDSVARPVSAVGGARPKTKAFVGPSVSPARSSEVFFNFKFPKV